MPSPREIQKAAMLNVPPPSVIRLLSPLLNITGFTGGNTVVSIWRCNFVSQLSTQILSELRPFPTFGRQNSNRQIVVIDPVFGTQRPSSGGPSSTGSLDERYDVPVSPSDPDVDKKSTTNSTLISFLGNSISTIICNVLEDIVDSFGSSDGAIGYRYSQLGVHVPSNLVPITSSLEKSESTAVQFSKTQVEIWGNNFSFLFIAQDVATYELLLSGIFCSILLTTARHLLPANSIAGSTSRQEEVDSSVHQTRRNVSLSAPSHMSFTIAQNDFTMGSQMPMGPNTARRSQPVGIFASPVVINLNGMPDFLVSAVNDKRIELNDTESVVFIRGLAVCNRGWNINSDNSSIAWLTLNNHSANYEQIRPLSPSNFPQLRISTPSRLNIGSSLIEDLCVPQHYSRLLTQETQKSIELNEVQYHHYDSYISRCDLPSLQGMFVDSPRMDSVATRTERAILHQNTTFSPSQLYIFGSTDLAPPAVRGVYPCTRPASNSATSWKLPFPSTATASLEFSSSTIPTIRTRAITGYDTTSVSKSTSHPMHETSTNPVDTSESNNNSSNQVSNETEESRSSPLEEAGGAAASQTIGSVSIIAALAADPVTIIQLDAVASVMEMSSCEDADMIISSGDGYDFSNNPLHIFIEEERSGSADRGALLSCLVIMSATSLALVLRSVVLWKRSTSKNKSQPITFHLIGFPSVLVTPVAFVSRLMVRSGTRLTLFMDGSTPDIAFGSVALACVALFLAHQFFVTLYSIRRTDGGKKTIGPNADGSPGTCIYVHVCCVETAPPPSSTPRWHQLLERWVGPSCIWGARRSQNDKPVATSANVDSGSLTSDATHPIISNAFSPETRYDASPTIADHQPLAQDLSTPENSFAVIWIQRYSNYASKTRHFAWFGAYQLLVTMAVKLISSAATVQSCLGRNIAVLLIICGYFASLILLRPHPLPSDAKWIGTVVSNGLLILCCVLNTVNSADNGHQGITQCVVVIALMITFTSLIGSVLSVARVIANRFPRPLGTKKVDPSPADGQAILTASAINSNGVNGDVSDSAGAMTFSALLNVGLLAYGDDGDSVNLNNNLTQNRPSPTQSPRIPHMAIDRGDDEQAIGDGNNIIDVELDDIDESTIGSNVRGAPHVDSYQPPAFAQITHPSAPHPPVPLASGETGIVREILDDFHIWEARMGSPQ